MSENKAHKLPLESPKKLVMMNYTTPLLIHLAKPIVHKLFNGLTRLALLTLILLPCLGVLPKGYGGWLANPPVQYQQAPKKEKHPSQPRPSWRQFQWQTAWKYAGPRLVNTGYQVGLMLALTLPLKPGAWKGGMLAALPLLRWMVAVSAVAWPWWGQSVLCRRVRQVLYRVYQLSLLALAGVSVCQLRNRVCEHVSVMGQKGRLMALGGMVKREANGWQVAIKEPPDGPVKLTLTGPNGDRWFLHYSPVDEFDRRMLLNVLRHIWTPEDTPKRPFLRQEWLAAGFDTHQELISRWQRYRREADWRRMMSKRHRALLTLDQVGEIVDLWAPNFWWTAEEVQQKFAKRGKGYSLSQVKEAGQLSGLLRVRRRLRERFKLGPETVKPKEKWLATQLFEQIERLLSRVEAEEALTPEERLELDALQAQRQELGLGSGIELEKPLPWMYRIQHVLFGWWEEVEEDGVRCLYCGSTQVAQKSSQPRMKKYYDREGELQEIAVCRYYCKNPACEYKSFTNMPPNLVPRSRWSVEVHLLALQGYAWGRSTYRLVGQSVGVSTATAYRWVKAWGRELLPMAALFGVVRSSGIVGVDEKWVKVPKNDKPEGKRKKWMYVYMAVDVYTYDLLHIAIYPYLTKASAHSFLLELKTKGYQPAVIITDLRRDYGRVITKVFPQARHHECIFHALKWIQRQIKEVYGADYKTECPKAVELKESLYNLFQCKDKRTSQKRYQQVMKLRQQYVEEEPEVVAVFDTLERHWPKLVNAMGSSIIPKTNNAVELVIRRFDQHYQNFCGFETIQTAQCYLAVFELVYRFTPFAKYNKKDKERPPERRIGGKCPLELAGYEVKKLPIMRIFRGRILDWPEETRGDLVPNV